MLMNRPRKLFNSYVAYMRTALTAGIIGLIFRNRLSPKLTYALVYLWLIPIFAFIYTYLPGDQQFYHSHLEHEGFILEQEQRISSQLEREILQNLTAHGNRDISENWSVDDKSLKVRSLSISEEQLTFRLLVGLAHVGAPFFRLYIDPVVKFNLIERSASAAVDQSDNALLRLKLGTIEIPRIPYAEADEKWNLRLAVILFPESIPEMSEEPRTNSQTTTSTYQRIYIPISESLDEQIFRFAKALEGDPSKIRGYFSRMLYLSAVTITALGTSDISPLTATARWLISLERLLGIVVIGLFLTEPRSRPARKESDSTETRE